MPILRHPERFVSNRRRVLLRFLGRQLLLDDCGPLHDLLAVEQPAARRLLRQARHHFKERHRWLERCWDRHCAQVVEVLRSHRLDAQADRLEGAPRWQRRLVGSYATCEYSVESAAFFNPSIVPHPDQSGLPAGSLRFILSFRAVGEGHLSSVVFRSGTVDADLRVVLDPPKPLLTAPRVRFRHRFECERVRRRQRRMDATTSATEALLAGLPARFNRADLETLLTLTPDHAVGTGRLAAEDLIRWLVESNYSVRFTPDQPLDERVLFPVSAVESKGIEDARFVRFVPDRGHPRYYATYTAWNGRRCLIQLIETTDFLGFRIRTLYGAGIRDKGMALFPRPIAGGYAMLGRQDGRTITLSRSRHLHQWGEAVPLLRPREDWELLKLGNCGSPLETDAGWLVITHGVGSMRRYCLGAALLDRENPTKVLGRLRTPLLEPTEDEREGYVPNVLYSCGSLIHNDHLVLPYATSDSESALASIPVAELIGRLLEDGP